MLTNLRHAFWGQSRSPNIVPFHMLGIVSYCAIVTLSLRRRLSAGAEAQDSAEGALPTPVSWWGEGWLPPPQEPRPCGWLSDLIVNELKTYSTENAMVSKGSKYKLLDWRFLYDLRYFSFTAGLITLLRSFMLTCVYLFKSRLSEFGRLKTLDSILYRN